jgi:hypothetical protein
MHHTVTPPTVWEIRITAYTKVGYLAWSTHLKESIMEQLHYTLRGDPLRTMFEQQMTANRLIHVKFPRN